MNPILIAETEPGVIDHNREFLSICAFARRSAEVRSATAIALALMSPADREDFEQEALLAVWRALPQYNPSRASLRTFAERVVATRFASLIRARGRLPRLEAFHHQEPVGLDGIPTLELRADIQRISAGLPERDRRLAVFLADHSPTEASRAFGVSRSTVYQRISRIRVAFQKGGFGPGGRCLP